MARRSSRLEKKTGGARERFEERMERASKRFNERHNARRWAWHEEWHGSCHCGHEGGALGFIWPLLSSLLGVFLLFVLASAFDYFGYKAANSFFSLVSAFLFANLGLFFGLMLVFGYAKWLTRRFLVLKPFKPLVKAARATIALWIIALLFVSTGIYASNSFFGWLTLFIQTQLPALFLLFLVLAYVSFLIKMRARERWRAEGYAYGEYCPECGGKRFRERKEEKRAWKEEKWGGGKYKRLYRSDENRILGGVCGGIAEYFDVDPVIVRLLWVIAALVWGVGVFAYLIAWIIVPRRPRT